MNKFISKSCLNCNILFEALKTEVKRGNGKFCSHGCCASFRHLTASKPEPNLECAYCTKKFYKMKSKQKLSRSGLHFCNRACKDAAQRIGGIELIQPQRYRGKLFPTHDYRNFAFNNLPYCCNRCGYDKKRILIVHHKDRDRTNNTLSNLEILCPNCHAAEHWFPDQK